MGEAVSMDWSEKRRAQRVEARLNLEIQLPRADGSLEKASLQTINISSSGVYFRSDKFLEPMTKLAMRLDLSVPVDDGDGTELAPVSCEGIVVRTDPEAPSPECSQYESAVFFTSIDPESMANLERHIAMLLNDS